MDSLRLTLACQQYILEATAVARCLLGNTGTNAPSLSLRKAKSKPPNKQFQADILPSGLQVYNMQSEVAAVEQRATGYMKLLHID